MKTVSVLRSSLTVALVSSLLPFGAHAFPWSAKGKGAQQQVPKQSQYFDVVSETSGNQSCKPKGKLKELVHEPYNCNLNLDECKASVDTLTGTIDAGFFELFANQVAIDPSGEKPRFINTPTCGDGPQFVEMLAIRGLGYSRDAKYAPLLAQIVEGPRAEKAGRGLRDAVTEALAYLGDKAAAEGAYKNLLAVRTQDPEYKRVILEMLGRWKSDAGIEFCTGALTNDEDRKVRESCIFYLGQRQAKSTIPVLRRILEKYQDVTMRAFGQMGDRTLLKDVQAYLEEKDGSPFKTRLPAVVAAINLGDANAMNELQTWMSGKRPMSKKDQERAAKSKSKSKPMDSFDAEFVHAAAMESVLLTDTKAIATVKKTLAAAAATKDDKKWQAHVFATVALAQLGDAKGIASLAELVNSPKKDLREAVINAIGGHEMHPGDSWMLTGYGFVADKGVAAELEKYLAVESNKQSRLRAVTALGTTRSMLVGQ